MKRMLVLSALGLSFVIASVTYGANGLFENYNLHGEYSIVGSRVCIYEPPYNNGGGFADPPGFNLLANGHMRTGHFKGALRLRTDGTGHYDEILTQMRHPNTAVGAMPFNISETSCEVNYQSFPNGTIEIRLVDCTGEIEAGLGYLDPLFSIDGVVLSGEVSVFGNILLSDMEPNIENVESPLGQTPPRVFPRICTRSATATRRW